MNTNALLRIRKYLDYTNARSLCTAYILSHFKYCPTLWMFSSRTSNLLINKTHKRALRVVHNNFHLSLEELLTRENSVHIHIQNLRILMIEVFKSLNSLNPVFMSEMFDTKKTPYSLRSSKLLKLPATKHFNHGIYGLSFRAALLWNQLPSELHCVQNIRAFKSKINNWAGETCTCKICR